MEWSTVLWLGGGGGVLMGLGYEIAKLNPKYRKIGLTVVLSGVTLLAGLLVANFWPTQKPTAQAAVASSSKSLGFTVAEFKDRFNQAAKRTGAQQRVEAPVLSPAGEAGQVDTFRVLFGDSLAMVGSADKVSHVVSDFLVLYVCEDKSRLNDELLELVTISGVLIEMCNPGVTADQRVGVLRELGLFGGQTKAELRDFDKGKDYMKTAQVDQVRYSFRLSPGGRAYFTAQPL